MPELFKDILGGKQKVSTPAVNAVSQARGVPAPVFFTPLPPPQRKDNVPVEPTRSIPSMFSDVRKFLFPTFDEQVQSVQDERRASFLPDVARKMAFEKDKEQGIFRLPQLNPSTGKLENTGAIADPTSGVGALKKIGIKGLKVAEEEIKDVLSAVIGKSAKDAEKVLPKVVEGTVDSVKTLAGKVAGAKDADEAVSIVKNEVTFFRNAASEAASATKKPAGKTPVTIPEMDIPRPVKFEPIKVPRNFVKQAEKTAFTADDVADITRRIDVLGLGTRTIRTFDEVEQAAQELGTDIPTLLRARRNAPISDVEGKALKNTIAAAHRAILEAQTQISRDPSLAAELEPKIQEADKLIDEALKKLVPGVTEAGRALNALRMQANDTLDPAVWFLKAQRMLGPRNLTDEMRGHIQNLIDNKDRVGLSQYVAMLRSASWAEKAATLWKAGLLTAFRTHEANILGNTTMALLETATNVVSTSFDVLAALYSGTRTVTFSTKAIAGKAQGLATGVKKAGTFFKTGVYSSDIMSKYEVRQVTFDNKILDGYTKAVFRSLGAEDIIFREMATRESFVTQAQVIAKNEGLGGKAYKERVRELLEKPTNEMVRNAIDAAEYQTFQSDSKLAGFITAAKVTLQNSDSPIAKWGGIVLEFIAPFAKTPINIAKAIADYSPIGFVKAIMKAAPPQTRSQKEFVKDLGRATTGTGFITLGAYLAQQGLMTGNAPTEKNERDMFYAEGKQPNSILIGGYWFKLARISPSGNLLSLGAEFNELSREQEGAALASATFWGGAKNLSEMTFLQGVSGLVKSLNDPEQYASGYVERGLGSFIPTIVAHSARAIDPRLRVPDGIIESFKSRTPVLSKDVPVRRDIFGNPVVSPGGTTAIVNPFEPTKAVESRVIDAAKEVGVDIGLPTPTISNIRLDNAEYSLYQKVQGKILRQTLEQLVDSDGYKALSTPEKEKEFKNTITEVRQAINDSVFPALMIRRYNLPEDTNPAHIRIALSELGKNDAFKRMSTERQEKTLKKLLQID